MKLASALVCLGLGASAKTVSLSAGPMLYSMHVVAGHYDQDMRDVQQSVVLGC